jgi:hypothetical protein
MHSHNHQLSVRGDNADHPFDLNDPQEEDQGNLHAGDYFPQVQVIFTTIIVHVKKFDNLMCSTCSLLSISLSLKLISASFVPVLNSLATSGIFSS